MDFSLPLAQHCEPQEFVPGLTEYSPKPTRGHMRPHTRQAVLGIQTRICLAAKPLLNLGSEKHEGMSRVRLCTLCNPEGAERQGQDYGVSLGNT